MCVDYACNRLLRVMQKVQVLEFDCCRLHDPCRAALVTVMLDGLHQPTEVAVKHYRRLRLQAMRHAQEQPIRHIDCSDQAALTSTSGGLPLASHCTAVGLATSHQFVTCVTVTDQGP